MRISRKKNSCWLFYLAFQSLKPLSLDRFLLAPGKYQQGHDNFCESRECSLSEDGNKNISMATCHKKVVLTKIKLKVYCKVRWNYWLLVIGVTGNMSIKSPKRLLWNKALYHISRQTALKSKLNNTLGALCFSEESKSKFSVMTSQQVYSWKAAIFTSLSQGYCWPSVIPVLKVHLSDLRLHYLTIIIIRCKFFFLFIGRKPTCK